MALSQKEITIGGQQYVIETLSSSEGLEAVIAITHILAGAAKGVGEMPGDSLADTPINMGQIVAGLFDRMDEKKTPAFVKWLVTKSVVRPDKFGDLYESAFAGAYDDLWELVEKILEHNNFGPVLKKRVQKIMAHFFSGGETDSSSTPSTTSP